MTIVSQQISGFCMDHQSVVTIASQRSGWSREGRSLCARRNERCVQMSSKIPHVKPEPAAPPFRTAGVPESVQESVCWTSWLLERITQDQNVEKSDEALSDIADALGAKRWRGGLLSMGTVWPFAECRRHPGAPSVYANNRKVSSRA